MFERLDATLRAAGYLPMPYQILDAMLVAAPEQRNTNAEKADLRAGRIPEDWQRKPAKLLHKDRHARWNHAIPLFGDTSHVSIDRQYRLIRKWKTADAGKSVIRSRVEHVFANQKLQMGLRVRIVGITRAIMRRVLFLERLNAST